MMGLMYIDTRRYLVIYIDTRRYLVIYSIAKYSHSVPIRIRILSVIATTCRLSFVLLVGTVLTPDASQTYSPT